MVTICERFSKLYHYYNFFCKASLFISGLILGHSFVQNAVTAFMISYLTHQWDYSNLKKAVIITSLQEGLKSVLVIFVAHIADTCLGRFKTIAFSTLAYVLGLMLLWLLDPANNIGIYLVVALLLAVGQAGRQPPLVSFLDDQLKKKDKSGLDDGGDQEEGRLEAPGGDQKVRRLEARTNICLGVFSILGAIIATFAIGSSPWTTKFQVSTIVMGVSLVLFCCGFKCYYCEEPMGSPLTTLFHVFKIAIAKRGLSYSNQPNDYFQNINSDPLPLMPNMFFFRWLDKAALIGETIPSRDVEEQFKHEIKDCCTVAQVKEAKTILRMVPMWATFAVYCLVAVTGSTFFFEQCSSLDARIGNFKVPIAYLYIIKNLSMSIISYLCNKIIKRWFKEKKFLALKVRIGIGMACSILCLVVARLVEIKRLRKVLNKEFIDKDNGIINMSIFWLTPQFCLLGLMVGLSEGGLAQFFYDQVVVESMKNYGPPFNEFVLGIGKFISIFWILTFSNWFGDSVNDSHLDNYYGILAMLGIANLCVVYAYVSKHIYKYSVREDQASIGQTMVEVFSADS